MIGITPEATSIVRVATSLPAAPSRDLSCTSMPMQKSIMDDGVDVVVFSRRSSAYDARFAALCEGRPSRCRSLRYDPQVKAGLRPRLTRRIIEDAGGSCSHSCASIVLCGEIAGPKAGIAWRPHPKLVNIRRYGYRPMLASMAACVDPPSSGTLA